MLRGNWLVGDYGIRPAGKPDECFYCGAKIATEHRMECVIRDKTVVVKVEMELVVKVPEDWDQNNIEFKYNDSSSCQDNIIQEINSMVERMNNDASCSCGLINVKYLREATEEDESRQKMFIRDSKG